MPGLRFGDKVPLMDLQIRELAWLCLMAALGGTFALVLERPLFAVAFGAEAALAAYASGLPPTAS
jgi:hypothetical protein